jgi:hypothetical protein
MAAYPADAYGIAAAAAAVASMADLTNSYRRSPFLRTQVWGLVAVTGGPRRRDGCGCALHLRSVQPATQQGTRGLT